MTMVVRQITNTHTKSHVIFSQPIDCNIFFSDQCSSEQEDTAEKAGEDTAEKAGDQSDAGNAINKEGKNANTTMQAFLSHLLHKHSNKIVCCIMTGEPSKKKLKTDDGNAEGNGDKTPRKGSSGGKLE